MYDCNLPGYARNVRFSGTAGKTSFNALHALNDSRRLKQGLPFPSLEDKELLHITQLQHACFRLTCRVGQLAGFDQQSRESAVTSPGHGKQVTLLIAFPTRFIIVASLHVP